MGDLIIVKYIKVDGQYLDNPLPRLEYDQKIGVWEILVEAEKHAAFLSAREGQEVEVEIGLHFGTLRDVGRVSIWRGELPDAPSFRATIRGNDPMQLIER